MKDTAAKIRIYLIPAFALAFFIVAGHRPIGDGLKIGVQRTNVHTEASKRIIKTPSTETTFKWTDITPTKHLVYHPCFDGHQCARLEVPLNWNSTAPEPEQEKLALAVVKLPAKVQVTDKRYGGPIFLNPGGPGGSGVWFATGRNYSRNIQIVADASHDPEESETGKYFDVMSFDPRGVNNTTPFHTCFSNPADAIAWTQSDDTVLGAPETSFSVKWARQQAVAQSCLYDEQTNRNGSKVAQFVGTASVVKDMVEILERHGEWREEQGRQYLKSMQGQSILCSDDAGAVSKRTEWRKGEEPLQYWGFSYGSILGATFAAMQPHRAYRVIVDGIADVEDYYRGGWLKNLQDTDAIMTRFFEYCHAAGPSSCALYTGDSSSDIGNAWRSLESKILADGPLPVPGSATRGPEIITFGDIENLVFSILYKPQTGFPKMANIMGPLVLSGNGSAFADWKHAARASLSAAPPCPGYMDPNDSACNIAVNSASGAIACSDADFLSTNLTRAEFLDIEKTLRNQSYYFGEEWANIRLRCAGWKAHAAFRPQYPLGSNVTHHPLLWIGNTLDPVTPLRNAISGAARFPGAKVLQLDTEGHCAISSASLCVGKTVRNFFQTGELPEDMRLCLPVRRPFLREKGANVEDVKNLGREEELLLEALNEMEDPEIKLRENDESIGMGTFGLGFRGKDVWWE